MTTKNHINVYDVTNYLIRNYHHQQLTNMKINKLLYYLQGHYVAKYDQLLFLEPMEAWMFGPVVPVIYEELFYLIDKPISKDFHLEAATNNELSLEVKQLIDQVMNKYGKLNAYELRDKTHQEKPWLTSYVPKRPWHENFISKEKLKIFFENRQLE